MLDNITQIATMVSEYNYQSAREICLDLDVEDPELSYNNLKEKATQETEIWGDESEYWAKALPKSADKSDSEWKFVLGNFLLSFVKECKTNGDAVKDAVICKSAHDILSDLTFANRHENLALALHNYKMGHIAKSKSNTEAAVKYFNKSIDIIEESDGLGGWHYESLVIRDITTTKTNWYLDQNENTKSLDFLNQGIDQLKSMNAPKSEDYQEQLESLKNNIKTEMEKQTPYNT